MVVKCVIRVNYVTDWYVEGTLYGFSTSPQRTLNGKFDYCQ